MTSSPFWKDKRVLITGGSGFIGGFLTERLLERGAKVMVVGRHKNFNALHRAGLRYVYGDLSDVHFAKNVVRHKDIVFHLAALKKNSVFYKEHPLDTFLANAKLAENLCVAAGENGVGKVVLMSSILVSDVERGESRSSYGLAKQFAEVIGEMCSGQYDMPVYAVRADNTFGPRDNFDPATAQVIPSLIRKVLHQKDQLRILGTGFERRSFIYVDDLVDVLMMLAEDRIKGFNIVEVRSKRSVAIKELAELLVRLADARLSLKFEGAGRGEKRRDAHEPTARAVSHRTVFTKTSLADGLKKTVDWYLENES